MAALDWKAEFLEWLDFFNIISACLAIIFVVCSKIRTMKQTTCPFKRAFLFFIIVLTLAAGIYIQFEWVLPTYYDTLVQVQSQQNPNNICKKILASMQAKSSCWSIKRINEKVEWINIFWIFASIAGYYMVILIGIPFLQTLLYPETDRPSRRQVLRDVARRFASVLGPVPHF